MKTYSEPMEVFMFLRIQGLGTMGTNKIWECVPYFWWWTFVYLEYSLTEWWEWKLQVQAHVTSSELFSCGQLSLISLSRSLYLWLVLSTPSWWLFIIESRCYEYKQIQQSWSLLWMFWSQWFLRLYYVLVLLATSARLSCFSSVGNICTTLLWINASVDCSCVFYSILQWIYHDFMYYLGFFIFSCWII